MKIALLFALLSFGLFAQDLVPCPQLPDQQTSYSVVKYLCNSANELVEESSYFKSTGTLSYQHQYQNGKLISTKTWASSGELRTYTTYLHNQDNTILKKSHLPENESILIDQILYLPQEHAPDKLITQWFYDSKTYRPTQIDHYIYSGTTKLVERRELFDKYTGEYDKFFVFTYPEGNPDPKHPKSYTIFDQDGNALSHYDPSTFSIDEFLNQHLDNEIKPNLIAIIDTDFDVRHHLLADKVFINRNEQIDGIDNDLNGLIDDIMGWNHETNSTVLLSPILLEHNGSPASHGTHVASIALEERDDTSFIGYAGDITNPEHLGKITRDLKHKKVKFTNMSFGFGNPRMAFNPGKEAIEAIEQLIKETPNTLHVIAAGNDYREIDRLMDHNYPASFSYNNILVVSALNTDKLEWEQMHTYQITDFSNRGTIHCDILAPGTKVDGAAPGGGMIRYSGTSMATPYALNHGVLNAYSSNPSLSILQIKELIIKSAYIADLDNPQPVKSGGILYPQRITATATLMKQFPSMTVEQAVLTTRRQELQLLPGEDNSEEYLSRLVSFWRMRGL